MDKKEYQELEAKCERIRKENKQLLNEFKKWLSGNKLKEKTIDNHIDNVDFFINDFLLYHDVI